MILNTHPDDRKTMVRAISDLMNVPAVYQYIPTYAYKIGRITVNRDGTIEAEDESVLEQIKPMLIEHGWLEESEQHMPENEEMAENQEAAESTETAEPAVSAAVGEENPDAGRSPEGGAEPVTSENSPVSRECEEAGVISVTIAASTLTSAGIQNLVRILFSHQKLINRMVQMDGLQIDTEVVNLLEEKKEISELEAMLQDESRVGMLKGFSFADGDVTVTMPADCLVHWDDYAALMEHIIRLAQISKYVKARVLEAGANEKYLVNTWLTRLGFGGKEYKRIRNVFMGHLRGYAAFRNDERMLAHKSRLAEQRRIKRELAQG